MKCFALFIFEWSRYVFPHVFDEVIFVQALFIKLFFQYLLDDLLYISLFNLDSMDQAVFNPYVFNGKNILFRVDWSSCFSHMFWMMSFVLFIFEWSSYVSPYLFEGVPYFVQLWWIKLCFPILVGWSAWFWTEFIDQAMFPHFVLMKYSILGQVWWIKLCFPDFVDEVLYAVQSSCYLVDLRGESKTPGNPCALL